jgi:hypothetical protein
VELDEAQEELTDDGARRSWLPTAHFLAAAHWSICMRATGE